MTSQRASGQQPPAGRSRRRRGPRLQIDLTGIWQDYTDHVPEACQILGTVTLGADDTGALVQLTATGVYVKVTAGKIAVLNQSRVRACLAALADETRAAIAMIPAPLWRPPR